MARIPLGLKLAYTAWMLVWIPCYWHEYGPANFLWFCDIGNFVLLAAVWRESRGLISWQAVSLIVVQIGWTLSFLSGLPTGEPLVGGANYMFNVEIPLHVRLLSLFHVFVLGILIWGMTRFGYDRRAFVYQCLTCWVVLPASFLFGPERNLNYVWAPFDIEQSLVAPGVYVILCMVGYPLLLYLPAHLFLRRFAVSGVAGQRGLTRGTITSSSMLEASESASRDDGKRAERR